jgi:hypothetical protein
MNDQEKYKKPDDALSVLNKFEIKGVLREISENIHANLSDGQKRFEQLEAEFNKTFSEEASLKGAAEVLIWAMLDVPLALFFLGQNSAVFVELHGFLERYALRDLPSHLAKDKKSAEIISSLIERRTLGELSDVLTNIELWDDKDVMFARKLANVRNGIVHKNAALISKHLGDGRDIHISDIEKLVNKTDCVPFIIGTIELLLNLSGAIDRAKKMEAVTSIYWDRDGHR